VHSRYTNFLQQLGIDGSIDLETNQELLKGIKQHVKNFNDSVRFNDSSDVSEQKTRYNKRKRDEAAAAQALAVQALAVQQYQGMPGDGTNAGGGPHMVVTTGVNGNAAVAGGVVDVPLAQRLSRPIHPPTHHDGSTVLLGANAGNRMRSDAAAAVSSTSYVLENLYNPDCTDIGSRFPSFRDLLPRIDNQFELVAQLSLILYNELESATEELKKVMEMVQNFNRAAPFALAATIKLTMDLVTYKNMLQGPISVGETIEAAVVAAPAVVAGNIAVAAAAAAEINPVEGVQPEELQPAAALPPPTATSCAHQLKGNGYRGGKVVIHRVDVPGSDLSGIELDSRRKQQTVTVPPGKYFLLSELFKLVGPQDGIDSTLYSKWKGWVSILHLTPMRFI
jgi:hypothetical protein